MTSANYVRVVGPSTCKMPKPETGLKWFEGRTPEQECGWVGGGPENEEEFYVHAEVVHGVDLRPRMWVKDADGVRELGNP